MPTANIRLTSDYNYNEYKRFKDEFDMLEYCFNKARDEYETDELVISVNPTNLEGDRIIADYEIEIYDDYRE